MDRASWCYVCGLLSAQSERLMERRDFLSLLTAESGEERQARLRSSVLFAEMPPVDTSAEQVEEAFAATVRDVAAIAPDDRIADLFLLGRDWQRFREVAKSQVVRGDVGGAEPGQERPTEDEERFAPCWKGEVEDERLKPFAEAARKIASEVPAEGDVAGWVDQVADAHEAASLVEAARALESEVLLDWVRTWVRLRSALSLIRARRIGWKTDTILSHWKSAGFDDPALAKLAFGEESGWAAALRELGLPKAEDVLGQPEPTVHLARRIDEWVSTLAAASSSMPFGPEPVFAFLWALRIEAINLRLALSAAAFGIPEGRLAEELRAGDG